MKFDVYKNYNPVGLGLVVIIGIGLVILFASVTPTAQIGRNEEPADPASAAARAQATEILDQAEDGDLSNELNRHLEFLITDYRILEQRFETHFDVSITAQTSAGLRGTNICLTLQLDVEENTLTKISDSDGCKSVSYTHLTLPTILLV